MVKAKHSTTLAPIENITRSILVLRGHRVLLDAELAALYGVETKVLVQAVKRNLARFPALGRLVRRSICFRRSGVGPRLAGGAFSPINISMLTPRVRARAGTADTGTRRQAANDAAVAAIGSWKLKRLME